MEKLNKLLDELAEAIDVHGDQAAASDLLPAICDILADAQRELHIERDLLLDIIKAKDDPHQLYDAIETAEKTIKM